MELTTPGFSHPPADRIRNYSEFIPSMDDPKAVAAITRFLSPAQKIDSVFLPAELEQLSQFAFSGKVEMRRNANGTVFVSGPELRQCYAMFSEKIEALLPGAGASPAIQGNFFITPTQYGLHNDAPRESDFKHSLKHNPKEAKDRNYVPWKNIIIPLWQGPENAVSQIIFFKQRHIAWAHVYNHSNATQGISTTYPIITNHGDIDFHDHTGAVIPRDLNLIEYDESHYNQYLKSTPRKRLTGLTPELTCNWEPGSLLIFDPVQLHATNKGQPAWNIKMGLLLTFLKEI